MMGRPLTDEVKIASCYSAAASPANPHRTVTGHGFHRLARNYVGRGARRIKGELHGTLPCSDNRSAETAGLQQWRRGVDAGTMSRPTCGAFHTRARSFRNAGEQASWRAPKGRRRTRSRSTEPVSTYFVAACWPNERVHRPLGLPSVVPDEGVALEVAQAPCEHLLETPSSRRAIVACHRVPENAKRMKDAYRLKLPACAITRPLRRSSWRPSTPKRAGNRTMTASKFGSSCRSATHLFISFWRHWCRI